MTATSVSSGLYIGAGGPRCSCLGELTGGENTNPDLECVKCGGSGLLTWWWGASEASSFAKMELRSLVTFITLRSVGMQKKAEGKDDSPSSEASSIINMTTLWPGVASGFLVSSKMYLL